MKKPKVTDKSLLEVIKSLNGLPVPTENRTFHLFLPGVGEVCISNDPEIMKELMEDPGYPKKLELARKFMLEPTEPVKPA